MTKSGYYIDTECQGISKANTRILPDISIVIQSREEGGIEIKVNVFERFKDFGNITEKWQRCLV